MPPFGSANDTATPRRNFMLRSTNFLERLYIVNGNINEVYSGCPSDQC